MADVTTASTTATSKRQMTARALLLGERIDVAGLERSDVISTTPLAWSMPSVRTVGSCRCYALRFAQHCEQPFPDCGSILPAPHTDEIFALIVSELGLFGGAGVILIYALIAARGFKTAVMARDGFSKLLAAGLTAVFALQAVVIIGGVVKFIPLTGVTLPFVSFGGSSVIANMILLGLLLMISNDARRPPAPREAEPDMEVLPA